MDHPALLEQPYALTEGQIDEYRRTGAVHLTRVLDSQTLSSVRSTIRRLTRDGDRAMQPLAERDTYGRAFTQVFNLWKPAAVTPPGTVISSTGRAGWVYHHAGGNRTEKPREVFTIIYLDKEARLRAPASPFEAFDARTWCPGVEPGELINSEINPVLYGRALS